MIPLRTKGKPVHIVDTLIGKVTRSLENIDEHSIFISNNEPLSQKVIQTVKAIITTHSYSDLYKNLPVIHSVSDLSYLVDGDIISIDARGNIHSLYRVNSSYNSLFVTEQCNNRCLMCSQPPKSKNDIQYLFVLNKELISLIPKSCEQLGVTGGEPTLLENKLFELLGELQHELPKTEIHVLTNGRKFSDWEYAKGLTALNSEHLSFGIPLYADYYALHDYIVQSEFAFTQTVAGLYHLARLNLRIEIRIVLHKLTVKRLTELTKFIYKNLPFVSHVAFMGLENMGYTPYNIDMLWIDPHDYMEQLVEAVMYLDLFHIPVSIYNLQLCILPKELWKFSRKSISDWKNVYVSECSLCEMKEHCGGFFESCTGLHSNYIKPITTRVE